MKFIALGTTEFAARCIEGFLDSGHQGCAVVSLPRVCRPDNAIDLAPFARSRGLAYTEVEDINAESSVEALRAFAPDVILVSWPRLLHRPVLRVPRVCCIGSHPTALPFNRGRHPLHWLIDLGFRASALSFFRMEEGVDNGKILLQLPYAIKPEETIHDVVAKVNALGYEGACQLGRMLLQGNPPEYAQNERQANYWRKRTLHDVTLDLRLPAQTIIRIIRSYTTPYPCARLLFKQHVLKVVQAALAPVDHAPEDLQRLEPGKILEVSGTRLRVKAGDRIIDLVCQEPLPERLRAETHIHPPTKYLADYPETFSDERLTWRAAT